MSSITHINPPDLFKSPAFSQGTLWQQGRLLFVGGQNGTDAAGQITGDVAAQSAQALRNVRSVLAAVGAGPADVAKLTVYLTPDADLDAAYGATAEVWGNHPTAVTVLRVAGLGRPEALVEIEAIAVVPEQE